MRKGARYSVQGMRKKLFDRPALARLIPERVILFFIYTKPDIMIIFQYRSGPGINRIYLDQKKEIDAKL